MAIECDCYLLSQSKISKVYYKNYYTLVSSSECKYFYELTISLIILILIFSKHHCLFLWLGLREKCPYSELLWSAFSRIRTQYGEVRSIPYSVQMRESADQNNSKLPLFIRKDLETSQSVCRDKNFLATIFAMKT